MSILTTWRMVKIALEHPVTFATAIGLDVFPQQVTTSDAVLRYGKVAIRGCHSSGKTFHVGGYCGMVGFAI